MSACAAENDSSEWFDVTPAINKSQVISPTDARTWVQDYAQLLALSHAAIQRNLASKPSMLYACIDRCCTARHYHACGTLAVALRCECGNGCVVSLRGVQSRQCNRMELALLSSL